MSAPDAPVATTHPLHVGRFVRHRRRRLGLRQHDLAAAVGVQYLWISKLENGQGGLDFSRVLRTLAALEIDIAIVARPGRPEWTEGFVRQRIPRAPQSPRPEASGTPRRRPRRWVVNALPGMAASATPRARPSRRKERPLYDQ